MSNREHGHQRDDQRDHRRDRDESSQAVARGGYRTLCVRVCDGYYFQLNFTASRKSIAKDAKKCESQYGPGEALLFYYPTPGGDPSEAISLEGERYGGQPYAFAFRSAYKPRCAAQLHAGLAELGRRALAKSEPKTQAVSTPVAPIPVPRPKWPADDPETVANRAGDFVPGQIAPDQVGGAPLQSVRVVGSPDRYANASKGPPRTVPGYKRPEPRDYRELLKADILPVPRS